MLTKVMFHPAADKLQVLSSSVDNTIRVWDLLLNSCVAVLGHASACSTFTFSRDGHSLLAAYRNQQLIVWNLQNRVKTMSLELHEEIEAMHYAYKNKTPYVLTFGERGVARILDLKGKQWVYENHHAAQAFIRCIYAKGTKHVVGITAEQNLVVFALTFDEDKKPRLDHVRDHIGFHDEIIDLALCPQSQRLVLATNSTLLK